MSDEQSGRHFDTEEPSGRSDTVRILPDSTPYMGPQSSARRESDPPPTQRGSLYAPATSPTAKQSYMPVPGGQSTANDVPEAAPPATVQVVRRGPSACAIIAGTIAILLFSCLLFAFAAFRGGIDGLGKLTGLMPNLGINLVTTPTVTIDVSRPSVIESVRALSKLETVHYELEKVVSGKSSGPLPDLLTSDKILLVAHGVVVAGVDFSKVRAENVSEQGTSVTIHIPKSEILYSKLDNDKTYVYDRQTGIFNKPDANLESQLRQAAEQQIVLAAQEDGILDKAQQNAEQTLRTMLGGLGYKDISIQEEP